MNEQYPRLSILALNYNYGRYLERMISSVLDQEYPNLELIIMDGGSTDISVELLQKYDSKIAYWQSKPDGGPIHAARSGFARATGDICGWIMSDDWYMPGVFAEVIELFRSHPEIMWCAGRGECVTDNNRVWRTIIPGTLDYQSMCGWPETGSLPAVSVFWRRSLYEQVGGICDRLMYANDYDLFLQFSRVSTGAEINRVLTRALTHPGQMSQENIPRYIAEVSLALFRSGATQSSVDHILAQSEMWREKYQTITRTFPVNLLLRLRRLMLGIPEPSPTQTQRKSPS